MQSLIKKGHVSSGGATIVDVKYRVKPGERFALDLPAAAPPEPRAEAIPLDVVYEDDALIVIDKPAGLVVHPGAGHSAGTLVNALIAHCGKSLSGIGGVARPGIVHRLDKDTSGLMVVAKTDAGASRPCRAIRRPWQIRRARTRLSRSCVGIPFPPPWHDRCRDRAPSHEPYQDGGAAVIQGAHGRDPLARDRDLRARERAHRLSRRMHAKDRAHASSARPSRAYRSSVDRRSALRPRLSSRSCASFRIRCGASSPRFPAKPCTRRGLPSPIRRPAHYSNLIVFYLSSSLRSLRLSRNCEEVAVFFPNGKGSIERDAGWRRELGKLRPLWPLETGSHGCEEFAECWRTGRTDALPRRNQTVSDAGAAAGVHARQELARAWRPRRGARARHVASQARGAHRHGLSRLRPPHRRSDLRRAMSG